MRINYKPAGAAAGAPPPPPPPDPPAKIKPSIRLFFKSPENKTGQ